MLHTAHPAPAPRPGSGPTPVRGRRWGLRRGDGDRGSLSLELSVLAPIVMMILFITIQAGMYFFARNAALTAAQQGVEAARVQGGTLTEGEARTWDLLSRSGGSISGTSVSGSSGALVEITVTGHVDTWIPGLSLPLSQTATGAKEMTAP